jgi:hypothetical protein
MVRSCVLENFVEAPLQLPDFSYLSGGLAAGKSRVVGLGPVRWRATAVLFTSHVIEADAGILTLFEGTFHSKQFTL